MTQNYKKAALESKFTKKKLLVLLAGVVLAGLALATLEKFHIINLYHSPKSSVAISAQTSPAAGAQAETVYYTPATSTDNNDSTQKKSKTQPTSGSPATVTPDLTLGVTISRFKQFSDSVQIYTVVDGSNTGTCSATLTKTGSPNVVSTGTVVEQNGYAVCDGLLIPLSQFGAKGAWHVSLTVSVSGRTSIPTEETFNYQ